MQCYRVIEIVNQEPLKIGAGGSKANQIEPSKEYIPGSTLRGAVIGQLVRQGTFGQDKQRILLEMACYNAYPYRNDCLYLPAPRHLRANKHNWRKKKAAQHDGKQDNPLYVDLTDLMAEGEEGEQAKNTLEYRFLALKNKSLIGLNVAKEYRLHHSTSKNIDKKEKENLFRYQAMAADQTFRAVIRFAPELKPLIENVFQQAPQVYLGGSKGSGYGLCQWKTIGEVQTDYRAVKHLLGLPADFHAEFNGQTGKELRITCLSDVLLRNEYGQPVNCIPESYIEEISGQGVKLSGQFIQTGITEGYNTTWQARYPKETTLKAGSVLRYTFLERPQSKDELQKIAEKLESRLLGGRIQDGFGWLGVNLPYGKKLSVTEEENQERNKKENTAGQILEKINGNEQAREVLNILVSGLEGAKERWLKMICVKSLTGDTTQEPGADIFILSSELKKAHLRQMQYLLENQLKKLNNHSFPASLPDFVDRSYKNDNRLCSIAGYNFMQIMKYLENEEENGQQYLMLTAYARKILMTLKGELFYGHLRQPEKQLIAELLNMGLSIHMGVRTNESKSDL